MKITIQDTINTSGDWKMPMEYCALCGNQIMYYSDDAIIPWTMPSGVIVKVHQSCADKEPRPEPEPKHVATKEEILAKIPKREYPNAKKVTAD